MAELTPTRAISESILDGKSEYILNGKNATLGLYVNNTNDKYKADHELYTFNGNVWSFTENAKDDTQVLFNGSSLDWIAYSPYSIIDEDATTHNLYNEETFSVPTNGNYNAGSEETTYKDVTSVSGSQYDLLWGKGTSGSAELTPKLYHTLTMLTVNITEFGTEIENTAKITAFKIGGTIPNGKLNLTESTDAADVVTIDNTVASADITALQLATANKTQDSESQYVASFEALIIPQTAALKLMIELNDNRVFTATLDSKEFLSGKHYNIKLRVGLDKVTLEGISAKRWNSIAGGDLATE